MLSWPHARMPRPIARNGRHRRAGEGVQLRGVEGWRLVSTAAVNAGGTTARVYPFFERGKPERA